MVPALAAQSHLWSCFEAATLPPLPVGAAPTSKRPIRTCRQLEAQEQAPPRVALDPFEPGQRTRDR
jgi:hypothetical protein